MTTLLMSDACRVDGYQVPSLTVDRITNRQPETSETPCHSVLYP
jgi:hypothetical protein